MDTWRFTLKVQTKNWLLRQRACIEIWGTQNVWRVEGCGKVTRVLVHSNYVAFWVCSSHLPSVIFLDEHTSDHLFPNISTCNFNPSHISMYIPHTVFYTLPEVLARRIKELLLSLIISFILVTLICDSGMFCKGKLYASHSLVVKGLGEIASAAVQCVHTRLKCA